MDIRGEIEDLESAMQVSLREAEQEKPEAEARGGHDRSGAAAALQGVLPDPQGAMHSAVGVMMAGRVLL